ncbi:MAG TPA: hypothetical protein PKA82_10585 [Pyrinomonadaceae bacterium]|nr:hypothetical protein [Pyrinomonadaceae bacterium]
MMTNENRKLDHIIGRMQTDTSVDAPADLIKFARNAFLQRSLAKAPSMLERIVAVLKMDLAPNRAAFGERSAGGSAARQMLFDAGNSAIDLRVTENGNMFNIRGQHIGDQVAESIQLESKDAKFTSKNDELKGFAFDSVPAGKYSLTITFASTEIVIDEIILG